MRATWARILFGVAVLSAAAYATGTPAPGAGPRVECKAVTAKRSGRVYNVAFRVRCTFNVTDMRIRTSKRLLRVSRSPTLERPDPGDQLVCRRRTRTSARCVGNVGENVRIRGLLKVRRSPCGRHRLRVRFRATGGPDCDPPGTFCHDIGYSVAVATKRPSGCGGIALTG